MTDNEAMSRAMALATRHFDHRVVTPRERQGFVLREQARLLSLPVPGGIDMPRAVTIHAPEPDLTALLMQSIKEVS